MSGDKTTKGGAQALTNDKAGKITLNQRKRDKLNKHGTPLRDNYETISDYELFVSSMHLRYEDQFITVIVNGFFHQDLVIIFVFIHQYARNAYRHDTTHTVLTIIIQLQYILINISINKYPFNSWSI